MKQNKGSNCAERSTTRYWLLIVVASVFFVQQSSGQVIIKERVEVEPPKQNANENTSLVSPYSGRITIAYRSLDTHLDTGLGSAEFYATKLQSSPAVPPATVNLLHNGTIVFTDTILDSPEWDYLECDGATSACFPFSPIAGEATCRLNGGPHRNAVKFNIPYDQQEILTGYVNDGDIISLEVVSHLGTVTVTEEKDEADLVSGDNNIFYAVEGNEWRTDIRIPADYNSFVCGAEGFGSYQGIRLIFQKIFPHSLSSAQTTIAENGSTEINVSASDKLHPDFDPEHTLDLTHSHASEGHYFALIGEDEVGNPDTLEVGTSLLAVPYKYLDPDFRPVLDPVYVSFIANSQAASKGPNLAGGFGSELNAASTTVEITATRYTPFLVDTHEITIESTTPTISILDANEQPANHLVISNWENAYEDFGEFEVKNSMSESNNFIDLDPSRFIVEITDHSGNSHPDSIDVLTAKIGTTGISGGDDLTEIHLTETSSDAGIFRSATQLLTYKNFNSLPLTGINVHRYDDDVFQAHDGSNGTVVDDTTNDRTHWAELGGTVNVEYTSSINPGELLTQDVAVCDTIKTVTYQPVTFLEPFDDVGIAGVIDPVTMDFYGKGNGVFDCLGDCGPGMDSEPYINFSAGYEHAYNAYLSSSFSALHSITYPRVRGEDFNIGDPAHFARGGMVYDEIIDLYVERANRAWAAGCIQLQRADTTHVVLAPKNIFGRDVFRDKKAYLYYDNDFFSDDVEKFYSDYKQYRTMDPSIVYVFFGPEINDPTNDDGVTVAFTHTTYTDSGGWGPYTSNTDTYIYISPLFDPIALAHELGHALTRLTHPSDPASERDKPYLVYPSYQREEFLHIYDYQVNQRRRLTLRVLNLAHENPDLLSNE